MTHAGGWSRYRSAAEVSERGRTLEDEHTDAVNAVIRAFLESVHD